jgi:hypothetical protein
MRSSERRTARPSGSTLIYRLHRPILSVISPGRLGGRARSRLRAAFACLEASIRKKTSVYIDGFNLYQDAIRGTPFRWLNLRKLCEFLPPSNDVIAIKYFTARVIARPSDPDQAVRQQLFLRATATLLGISIHYGHFLSHEIMMPRAPVSAQRQQ